MSVKTEIDRIKANVSSTYSVLESAGAEMPAEQSSDNLPGTAGSITAVLYGRAQSLTEEQKAQARENIGVGMVGEVTLPDYWESYLPNKIAAIKAHQDEGGKDCFSFVVMTDIHYPSNLGKRSPAIAKRIIDECDIKYALVLGDVRNRGCYDTKELAEEEWKNVDAMFSPLRGHILQTQGNHDAGYGRGDYDGDGDIDTFAYEFTPAEMFERVYRKAGMAGDAVYDASGTAFYIDDKPNKVRYIMLNTQLNFNGNIGYDSYETVNGMAKYPSMWKFRYTQCQYDFLINDALSTIPSDAWGIIIGSHIPINQSGEMPEYPVMVGVLNAYQNKTSFTGEYAGTAGGTIQAYTNLADPSTKGDSTSSKLWLDGYRLNSGGAPEANASYMVTNVIPCENGDVVRIKGLNASAINRIATALESGGSGAVYFTAVTGGTASNYGYSTEENGAVMVITQKNASGIGIRLSISTGTDISNLIITVNEPIEETVSSGYDMVSVECDFTNAKGTLIAYHGGHVHKDAVDTTCYPTGTLEFPIIMTRSDAKEENTDALKNERVAGTTTEQSFDVFTVNKKTRKIYATKIGAGADREISY